MKSVASMTLWYEVLCPSLVLHSQMGKQFKGLLEHTYAHTVRPKAEKNALSLRHINTHTLKQPVQHFCSRNKIVIMVKQNTCDNSLSTCLHEFINYFYRAVSNNYFHYPLIYGLFSSVNYLSMKCKTSKKLLEIVS